MVAVDFSPLGNLWNDYQKGRQDADKRKYLSQLQSGGQLDLAGAAGSGDMNLMQLALQDQQRKVQAERDARDFSFRQTESQRAQQNADRSYGQQERVLNRRELPPGFELNPAGGQRPIKGGVADPEYIQLINQAKTKPRQPSIGDITKLSEEGGKFSQVAGFGDTFKPEYAGYKSKWIGELANTAGRNLPEGVVGKDVAEGANWWQSYDAYKGVVRNDLYGSALTAPEIKSFEAADITPGMDDKMIARNLKRQKDIIQGAVTRKAGAMVESGYDPATIGKAYGIDLGALGVEGKKGKAAPSGVSGPARVTSPAERDALPPGTQYIAPDGSMRTKR